MKKSDFLGRLERTISLARKRAEAADHDHGQYAKDLASLILDTMKASGVKPPKWMERGPRTLADGSTHMRDIRWRHTWEAEAQPTLPDLMEDPMTNRPHTEDAENEN